MRKVSIINGICVRHDAISAAVRHAVATLAETGRYEARLFAYECHFPELPFRKVAGVGDIMLDRHYQDSDLVVFDYGITYPLFDLLPIVPPRAVRLVRFHNITPREYVDETGRALIDRSFAQLSNLRYADHVACVSEVNYRVLVERGFDIPATILPVPVSLPWIPPGPKPSARDGIVRIACIGRFVPSKGVLDLLRALEEVGRRLPERPMRVDLVGNLVFSDPAYLQELERRAESLPGSIRIGFHGSAEETTKETILAGADLFVLPSYHEGFCVPVIEALAAGCRAITYDNSNLLHIGGGFSRLVPTGDLDALAKAIAEEAAGVLAPDWHGTAGGHAAYRAGALAYAAGFAPEEIARRWVRLVDALLAS